MNQANKDTTAITLFFVKNLNHQFTQIETFLKKRGYRVFVETDIKVATDRILEENPEYVFLAWDHKNENIHHMPKTIYQSCTSSVVPFIMSTQRDQINKMDNSGFENKLYPPLSGPAIIRIISKHEKKNQIFEQINNQKATNPKKESQMIQVKSFFKSDDDNGPENNIKKSNFLDSSDRNIIASRRREKLNMFAPQNTKRAQLEFGEKTAELDVGGGISLSDGEHLSEFLPHEAKSLSEGQIIFLDQSFTENVKPEIFDVIETYADKSSEQLDLTATTQIYVLVVQELEWIGYLTVASENYLDVASAQVILNNWIKQMIHIEHTDQNDLPDSVFFEVRVSKVDFADFCSYKSDFFKEIEYEGKKTMIGFFSLSPYQVINSIHESFDMLELPTEFLQPNKDLPFDINLYLPENKKFILYVRPDSYLDNSQVNRLQTRNVKYVFSNIDYESAMLKYKAEFNINTLINIYNRMKASNT